MFADSAAPVILLGSRLYNRTRHEMYTIAVVLLLSGVCLQISLQKPQRCQHEPETGLCRARIPRLYFNTTTNSCIEFIYGGCGGNDNNFETLQDCNDICVTEKATEASGDRCSLLPHEGTCQGSLTRLYYDTDTNTCKEFVYGGCGGNLNNFESPDECKTACVKNYTGSAERCYLKPEVGPCLATIPRLYYDVESNACREFFYGGCAGNSNNFGTVDECDKACVSMSRPGAPYCYLNKEEGPCKGKNPRLYYDPRTQTCKQFNYGGCNGNQNNFKTFEECEDTCTKSVPQENVCRLPAETGVCRALIVRFYYNFTTQTCGEFIYGGCGGNGNNFEGLDECEDTCDNNGGKSALLVETRLWFLFSVILATVIVLVNTFT